MAKTNHCVVRNEAYRRSSIDIRERHNERKNQGYSNPDIVKNRSHLNVHFKSCGAGYEQEFNRMVAYQLQLLVVSLLYNGFVKKRENELFLMSNKKQ